MTYTGKKIIIRKYFTDYNGIIVSEPINGFVKAEANGHSHSININELKFANERGGK
jgi:hypothetical protein